MRAVWWIPSLNRLIVLHPSPRLQRLLVRPNPRSFQSAVTLSQLEQICQHFHQIGDTSFSSSITRIVFSGSSFSIDRTIKLQLCLLLALLFLSWVQGSHPWLFFLMGPSGTWVIEPTTHPLGVSSSLLVNLPFTRCLADSFTVSLAPVAGCDRVSVSCSKHALLNASLALL